LNVIGFRHTGLIVEDLEKSLVFYKNFLKLEVIQLNFDDSAYISEITGVDNLKAKYAKLSVPGGTVIELLTYPSHPENRVERKVHQPGEAHLAFQVESVDSAFEAVVTENIKYLSKPVLSSEKIAKVFFALDPDGYRIEFVEMLTDDYVWEIDG
jgi:catechol 2,3-dioxygenase-like lactoylglutathione lyase family enzyme